MTFIINIFLAIVFSLPIGLILWMLFKKRIANKKTNLIILFIISYFISSLIVIIYILVSDSDFKYIGKPFSEKEWRLNSNERYKMSKDLIESKILLNKKKDEVINMIGKPQEEEKGKAIYLTGTEGSLYPRFYFLKVHYKNDTVIQVESYKVDED